MSPGGCGLSATIYYLSSPGLTAVYGPARARSLTRSQAEAVKESWPLASILGLAAHSSTLLMTPGYPVSMGGCGLSATIYYLSSLGLAAMHGPARAHPMTHSQAQVEEVKDSESRPLASTPLAIATLLATLGSATHIATLLLTPGYPVSTGG